MVKNVPAKVEESNAALAAAPDWMDKGQGIGVESLGQDDIITPRIKLIQAISPEVTTFDVKSGEYWHTLAEMSLGREVLVVPIYIDKRYILWKPREAGGGILARADDGMHWNPSNAEFTVPINKGAKTVKWRTAPTVAESGLADWGSFDPADPNSQPAATMMYTMVVMLPDYMELGPAVISMQRGSVKVARGLIGKLKISSVPSYGRVFRMSSTPETSPSGSFNNYKFEAAGFVQDKDHYEIFKGFNEQFSKHGVVIKDIEAAQDDEATTIDDGKF